MDLMYHRITESILYVYATMVGNEQKRNLISSAWKMLHDDSSVVVIQELADDKR